MSLISQENLDTFFHLNAQMLQKFCDSLNDWEYSETQSCDHLHINPNEPGKTRWRTTQAQKMRSLNSNFFFLFLNFLLTVLRTSDVHISETGIFFGLKQNTFQWNSYNFLFILKWGLVTWPWLFSNLNVTTSLIKTEDSATVEGVHKQNSTSAVSQACKLPISQCTCPIH